MKKILFYIIPLFFILPNISYGAWLGTDNLESYTIGDAIDGKSGGTGWGSGNWTSTDAVNIKIAATPSGGQGSNAIKKPAANSSNVARTMQTGTVAGQVYVMMQRGSSGNNDVDSFALKQGSNYVGFIRFYNSDIESYDGSTVTTQVTGYSANTWYTFVIKFGHVSGKWAVSVDGGATFSADYNYWQAAAGASIDNLFLSLTSSNDVYVDDIHGDVAASSPAIPPNFQPFWW